MVVQNANQSTILDGFTIRGGNANGNSDFLGISQGNLQGAGVFQQGGNGYFTLSNCVVKENKAVDNGGGMYSRFAKTKIQDCQLTKQSSTRGGVFNRDGIAEITNCSFTENDAAQGGAVMDVNQTSVYTDCTFTRNTATGSAIGGAASFVNSTITVTRSQFLENTAPRGGAIRVSNGQVTFNSCLFKQNTATAEGGAAYLDSGGSSLFSKTVFESNTAPKVGAFIKPFCTKRRLKTAFL
ncbi:MAG: hypothetical protein RL329_2034 [Bacteroidota bacterium]